MTELEIICGRVLAKPIIKNMKEIRSLEKSAKTQKDKDKISDLKIKLDKQIEEFLK